MAALPPPKPGKSEPLGDLETLPVGVPVILAAVLATAKKDPRQYMNGVLFRERDAHVEVVTTNGAILLVQRLPKMEKVPGWVKGTGTVVDADLLAKLAKIQDQGGISLAFGKNHPSVIGTTSPDFARFRLEVIESAFPDYVHIVERGDKAINGSEVAPLQSPALDPAYVKVAAQVGAVLEAKGVFPFLSHDGTPSVFAFGENAAAALYVMPLSAANAGPAFSDSAVRMLAPALKGTVAALRAHITRAKQLEAKATKAEEPAIAKKRADLEQRLAAILRASNQLEDKRETASK